MDNDGLVFLVVLAMIVGGIIVFAAGQRRYRMELARFVGTNGKTLEGKRLFVEGANQEMITNLILHYGGRVVESCDDGDDGVVVVSVARASVMDLEFSYSVRVTLNGETYAADQVGDHLEATLRVVIEACQRIDSRQLENRPSVDR